MSHLGQSYDVHGILLSRHLIRPKSCFITMPLKRVFSLTFGWNSKMLSIFTSENTKERSVTENMISATVITTYWGSCHSMLMVFGEVMITSNFSCKKDQLEKIAELAYPCHVVCGKYRFANPCIMITQNSPNKAQSELSGLKRIGSPSGGPVVLGCWCTGTPSDRCRQRRSPAGKLRMK